MSGGPFKIASCAYVRELLEGEPSERELRNAIASVEKLRADIAHFMHWPALVESLNCDAKMLRCKLGDHVR